MRKKGVSNDTGRGPGNTNKTGHSALMEEKSTNK